MSEESLDYQTLGDVLRNHDYALGLSPGFFRFYALTGVLAALEQESCLRATHISGSSAGALVGGFYASGWSPNDIIDTLMEIKREDIWDMGGVGGLLQGKMFQNLLQKHLKVSEIQDCKIPFGATAYDVLRASCTFPGLFQPVIIDNLPHIDGGVFDDSGLMALPGVPASNLIVNVVCGEGREASSHPPSHLPDALLLTIVLRNIPMVSPFTMATAGPIAYRLSREATVRALKKAKVIPVGPNRWVSHIDGPSFHSTTHSLHPPASQPVHHEGPSPSKPETIEVNEIATGEMEKKRKTLSEGPFLGYKQRRVSRAPRRRYYSSSSVEWEAS